MNDFVVNSMEVIIENIVNLIWSVKNSILYEVDFIIIVVMKNNIIIKLITNILVSISVKDLFISNFATFLKENKQKKNNGKNQHRN